MRTPVHTGAVLARATVKDTSGKTVRLLAVSSYRHVFPKSEKVRLRVTAPAQLAGPLARNAQVGSVAVVAGGRVVARIPLRTASQLPAIKHSKSIASGVVVSVTLFGLLVAAGAAIGLTMFWRELTRGRGGRATPR